MFLRRWPWSFEKSCVANIFKWLLCNKRNLNTSITGPELWFTKYCLLLLPAGMDGQNIGAHLGSYFPTIYITLSSAWAPGNTINSAFPASTLVWSTPASNCICANSRERKSVRVAAWARARERVGEKKKIIFTSPSWLCVSSWSSWLCVTDFSPI